MRRFGRLSFRKVAGVGLLALAGAVPSDAPVRAADPDPAGPHRFLEMKEWYGRIVITARGGGRRNGQDGSRSSWALSRRSEITFKTTGLAHNRAAVRTAVRFLPDTPEGRKAAAFMLNTQTYADMKRAGAVVSQSIGDASETYSPGTGGAGDGMVAGSHVGKSIRGEAGTTERIGPSVFIDAGRGVWWVGGGFPPVRCAVTEFGTSRPAPPPQQDVGTGLGMGDLGERPLPATGDVLSGMENLDPVQLRRRFLLPEYGNISGTVEWELSPKPFVPVDLWISAEHYDDWMPEADPTGGAGDKRIVLKAVLKARDGKPTPPAERISFDLDEVSYEPGWCLNRPVAGATVPTPPAAADFDLRFEAAHNSGGAVEGDGIRVVFNRVGTEATARLSSFDWGAFGTIKVTARIKDEGRIIRGRVLNQPTETALRIPKRPPESKIADAWKKLVGAPKVADEEDNDTQGRFKDKNKNLGDGLTAYEEYRGMIVKGRHTREILGRDGKPDHLAPGEKDLIVFSEVTGKYEADVKRGFKLFEDQSGIHVVLVERDDFPAVRRVNLNTGKITLDQHGQFGLRLVDEAIAAGAAGHGSALGLTMPVAAAAGRDRGIPLTPRMVEKVIIDMAAHEADFTKVKEVTRRNQIRMPYGLAESIATTVAHELGHAVNVSHHGVEALDTFMFTIDPKDPFTAQWKVFDDLGSEVTHRPVPITTPAGRPGCESSGDFACIMCYQNAYNWAAVGNRPYSYYNVVPQPLGKHFCTSPAATGLNAEHRLPNGKTLPGFFGDAARGRGNCLGAMKVRDAR